MPRTIWTSSSWRMGIERAYGFNRLDQLTWYFSLNSLLREALIILRRSLEGAVKWALRLFLRLDETRKNESMLLMPSYAPLTPTKMIWLDTPSILSHPIPSYSHSKLVVLVQVGTIASAQRYIHLQLFSCLTGFSSTYRWHCTSSFWVKGKRKGVKLNNVIRENLYKMVGII